MGLVEAKLPWKSLTTKDSPRIISSGLIETQFLPNCVRWRQKVIWVRKFKITNQAVSRLQTKSSSPSSSNAPIPGSSARHSKEYLAFWRRPSQTPVSVKHVYQQCSSSRQIQLHSTKEWRLLLHSSQLTRCQAKPTNSCSHNRLTLRKSIVPTTKCSPSKDLSSTNLSLTRWFISPRTHSRILSHHLTLIATRQQLLQAS